MATEEGLATVRQDDAGILVSKDLARCCVLDEFLGSLPERKQRGRSGESQSSPGHCSYTYVSTYTYMILSNMHVPHTYCSTTHTYHKSYCACAYTWLLHTDLTMTQHDCKHIPHSLSTHLAASSSSSPGSGDTRCRRCLGAVLSGVDQWRLSNLQQPHKHKHVRIFLLPQSGLNGNVQMHFSCVLHLPSHWWQ